MLTAFCSSSASADSVSLFLIFRQCMIFFSLPTVFGSSFDSSLFFCCGPVFCSSRSSDSACYARSSHSSLFLRCWQCFSPLLVVYLLLFFMLFLFFFCCLLFFFWQCLLVVFFIWRWLALLFLRLTVVCNSSSDSGLPFFFWLTVVCPSFSWYRSGSSALSVMVFCSSFGSDLLFVSLSCFALLLLLTVFYCCCHSDGVFIFFWQVFCSQPSTPSPSSHTILLFVFFFRQRFAVPLSCPLYRLVCHTRSRLSMWDSQPTNPRACSADVRAPYTRKRGHSTGPKDPRLQKSSGAVKRIWCRQPASSVPSS